MISSLNGRIEAVGPDGVEICVNGVGYEVYMPTSCLAKMKVGAVARIMTHLVVREDSMTLFGFTSYEMRQMFEVLTTVSGVGPKMASAILSRFDPPALARAVSSADIDALTTVPGVGKRGAERLVLELKDKIGAADVAAPLGSKLSEVREALIGLGYTPAELRDALARLDENGQSVEEMVRNALKELSRV